MWTYNLYCDTGRTYNKETHTTSKRKVGNVRHHHNRSRTASNVLSPVNVPQHRYEKRRHCHRNPRISRNVVTQPAGHKIECGNPLQVNTPKQRNGGNRSFVTFAPNCFQPERPKNPVRARAESAIMPPSAMNGGAVTTSPQHVQPGSRYQNQRQCMNAVHGVTRNGQQMAFVNTLDPHGHDKENICGQSSTGHGMYTMPSMKEPEIVPQRQFMTMNMQENVTNEYIINQGDMVQPGRPMTTVHFNPGTPPPLTRPPQTPSPRTPLPTLTSFSSQSVRSGHNSHHGHAQGVVGKPVNFRAQPVMKREQDMDYTFQVLHDQVGSVAQKENLPESRSLAQDMEIDPDSNEMAMWMGEWDFTSTMGMGRLQTEGKDHFLPLII